MIRNFGVVYMSSYIYAYFILPEHTKRVKPITVIKIKATDGIYLRGEHFGASSEGLLGIRLETDKATF